MCVGAFRRGGKMRMGWEGQGIVGGKGVEGRKGNRYTVRF